MLLEQIAQHGLPVALVGEFEDEAGLQRQHAADLGERLGRIRHVVQGADHGRAVEDVVHKGQMINIRGHEAEARRIAEMLARLQQLCA